MNYESRARTWITEYEKFKRGEESLIKGDPVVSLAAVLHLACVNPGGEDAKHERVARGCLKTAIEYIEFYSACPWCECGTPDDDGGDKPHGDDCPLHGYDTTDSINVLKQWLGQVPG